MQLQSSASPAGRGAEGPAAGGLPRAFGLDALRGCAIGMVLLLHFGQAPWAAPLWTGVDLFFVLSGYLLGGILIDARGRTRYFRTFYARRAARILPLYAILLLPRVLDGIAGLPGWHFALFLQNFDWAASGEWGRPEVGVTWSLAIEEQFYLMLAPLVWWLRPALLPFAAALLAALAPVCRAGAAAWFGNTVAPFVLMPCRMDALFFGVLAAWAVRQPWIGSVRPGWLFAADAVAGAIAVAGFAAGLSPADTLMWLGGFTVIDGGFALLVLGVVTAGHGTALRGWAGVPDWVKPLGWLGIGAYAIYLFHVPMMAIAEKFAGAEPGRWLGLPLVLAFGLWKLEARIIAAARSRFYYGPARRPQAV